MTESGEQERFEKWAVAQGDSVARHCKNHFGKPCHKYLSTFTHWEWEAWQAAFEAGRGGWISAEERLPEDGEFVLVAGNAQDFDGKIIVYRCTAKYIGVFRDSFGNTLTEVTHWQSMTFPLPAPPDSGDKKGTGDAANEADVR